MHLLRQACGALTEAHAAGLIHRDIKPANLMLCVYGGIPDFVKVLDFGLVKEIGDVEHAAARTGTPGSSDAALSQDGSLLGTPLYMAPEGMSDPAKVDARADIFALGAVGYFLLTGNSPFPGRTAIEVFKHGAAGPAAAARDTPRRSPCPPRSRRRSTAACRSSARSGRRSAEELDAMLEPAPSRPPGTARKREAWWRERGPRPSTTARGEREEEGRFLFLRRGPALGPAEYGGQRRCAPPQ